VLRQELTTPSVSALLARALKGATPLNGAGVAVQAGIVAPTVHLAIRTVPNKQVREVSAAVERSGVAAEAERLLSAGRVKPGRPALVNLHALLTVMLLNAMDGRGCLMSDIAATMYRGGLSRRAQDVLGIKPLPAPDADTKADRDLLRAFEQKQVWAAEARVRAAFQRLLRHVDPSIHPRGRVRTWEELDTLKKNLTPEEVEARQAALSDLCNRLVRIPFALLPDHVRARYNGSVCIDGTPMKSFARKRRKDSLVASVDPDTGIYFREGTHADTGEQYVRHAYNAYDINLMVAVCDNGGGKQYIPTLPIALHLNRPGADPSGAFRRMATNLVAAGWQPGYLTGDGLYADADGSTFQTPARQLGFKVILPILDGHLGIQAVIGGYNLVEGDLYCSSMPQHLVDATKDYRADRLTHEEYQRLLRERLVYRARLRETLSATKSRLGCPASGTAGKAPVMCSLKPSSEVQKTKLIAGIRLAVRDRIVPDPRKTMNGVLPTSCSTDTQTLDMEKHPDYAKFAQDLQFGTDLHTDTYNTLRQSQEGMHGFSKDDAKEALATPGLRRVHGIAANSFFAAVLLAAAGIRKVNTFTRLHKVDQDGHWYLPRRKREGAHAPTHMPPGTKGTRGDPDDFDWPKLTEEEAA
jgi:hypothetical protein